AEVRASIKNDAPSPIAKPGKIVVLGNYIFLNEVDKGVHIIDNTNPAAPVNKYFISIPGNVDIAVKGNTLYADLYKDLVTIDISNPSAIAVKNITKNVFPPRYYQSFANSDTGRIIVDWIKKDTVVNAADQRAPGGFYQNYSASSMASAPVPSAIGVSGSMARFAILNNYLYAVTDYSLNVFDISQPDNPVFTNQKNIGWQIETIFPFKGNLFIGSRTGVFIFSIANPAQPSQLSMCGHLTLCDPVIADDKYAFVTLRGGTTCGGKLNQLDVLDISNISNPRNVKSYPLTNPKGLSKDGNLLFICDGEAGLKVFDASDVNNLKLLQTISGIDSYDIIAVNNIAIVVTTDGLYQYDYTNSKQVTLKSKITYGM
ncbi:MAG: LVIVD repeat-containing protein, partial [Segetibacter sp.]